MHLLVKIAEYQMSPNMLQKLNEYQISLERIFVGNLHGE